jgi:hypothetical protein
LTHFARDKRSVNGSDRFALEREMLDWFAPKLAAALPSLRDRIPESVATVREPAIGAVSPDLLYGAFRSMPPSRLRGITYLDAHVLSLLETRSLSGTGELLSRLHIGHATAERVLTRLMNRNWVVRSASGRLTLAASLRSSQMRLLAVEFKLSRWKDALAQALSYCSFAAETYVLLDGSQFRPMRAAVAEFRHCGVGLLVNNEGRLRVIVRASRTSPVGPERFIAAERLLRALPAC